MSRKTYNTFIKIIGLLLLSLIFFLPLTARSSTKTLVLFPLAIYADQSKAYLGQGIKRMLISRISGAGIEIVPDEKYIPLLDEKEKEGIIAKERAEELARVLKADYAIFGSITTIGGGYSLDLSLVALEKDASKLTGISKAVDEEQLIPQLSDVAYQLRALIEGKEMPSKKLAGKPSKKTAGKSATQTADKPSRKGEEKATVLPKPQTAKGIFSQIEGDKKEPKATEKGLFFKPTKEYQGFKPTGKISVGMSVMAFDMGDLDGKGGEELVVLGRKKLLLYTMHGASFALKDSLNANLGEDFFKVSVGDADNNGRAEIYLVSRYGVRARSTVFEWAGGFKRLDRLTGHMQVVKDPASKKSLLLFQDSRVGEFFSGRIYGMKHGEGGKLTKGEKLPELEGGQFYTLALFDLDKDQEAEWLGLGEPDLGGESNLYVWDRAGAIIWSGKKGLGGTNNAIRLEEGGPQGDLPPMISFNSRLAITDIDGDGEREILAIKNVSLVDLLQNIKVYIKSNLIAYRREGLSLSPAWTTGDIDWCVTDMQAQGQTLFLAAQKGKIANIGKGSGQIMWFE
jgi:hypothetical protein